MRNEHYSVLGLLLASAATASAFEPSDLFLIQKGPVALKPQLNVSTSFNDNVSFREENKISDFLATASPGLELTLGTKEYNRLDLSYFYDRLQYFSHDEFNANQHRFAAGVRFEYDRLTLDGQDRIEFLSSPLGGGLTLSGEMIDRTIYSDAYRLTYELTERTAVYGGITHALSDYDDGTPLFDSQTLIGTLGFQYRGFSRTFFFGELYYGQTESEFNLPTLAVYPTARFVGGFVGARGYFTEKLTGTVKAGYETRDYSDGSEGSGAPVVEASLTYQVTEASRASVAYSRRQNESVQFVRTTYTSDTFSVIYQQDFGADKRLHGDLTASYLAAAYQSSGALTSKRDDNLINAGLTITYDVKLWMRVFGGYSFEWLDSNLPSIVDYTVNRVTVGLQLGY